MFSLTVRRNFMIAHSLPRPAFGPAQGLHGATFVTEVTFRRRTLNEDAIVLDIGEAGEVLDDVLAGLNYKNLDEHPDFAGKLSTTEALAQYIADAVAGRIRGGRGREGARRHRRHPARNSGRLGQLLARVRRRLAAPWTAPGLRLLVPGNVRHNSGGNAYNAALLRALAELGVAAESYEVDGDWPVGSAADRHRFGRLLTESDAGRVTLVDGLVACGAPDELEAAAAAGAPAWILLHMPLAGAPGPGTPGPAGRGRRHLHQHLRRGGPAGTARAARRAPGRRDQRRAARHRRPPRPPPDPSRRTCSRWPRCCPTRTSCCCCSALAGLTDLPWTASLAGSDTADPGYAALLRRKRNAWAWRNASAFPASCAGPRWTPSGLPPTSAC